jgi:hypothetical protein
LSIARILEIKFTIYRFRVLAANLRFDDEEDRGGAKGRWQSDRFAAIRFVFSQENEANCETMKNITRVDKFYCDESMDFLSSDTRTFSRELFELWNVRCAKAVHCGDLLTIDETHYPMKTPVAFL